MSKKNTPSKRAARQARDQKARQRIERRKERQPSQAFEKLGRLLELGAALSEQAQARGPEALGLKGALASDLFLAVDPSMREAVIGQAREQAQTLERVASGVIDEMRSAIGGGKREELSEWLASPERRGPWLDAADRALTWTPAQGQPGFRIGKAVLRARALSEIGGQKQAWAQSGFDQLRSALANVLEIGPEDVAIGSHPIDLQSSEPTLDHFEALAGPADGVASLAGDPGAEQAGWLGFVVSARCDMSKLGQAERMLADATLGELAAGKLDFFSTLLRERLAEAAGGSGSPMTFSAAQQVGQEAREVEFCLEGIDDPMSAAMAGEREAMERAMEAISEAAKIAVERGADKEKMSIVLDLGMLYADEAQVGQAKRSALLSFCAEAPERSFGVTFSVVEAERPMAFSMALLTVFSEMFDLSTEARQGLATMMFCEPREDSYVDGEGRLLFWTPEGMMPLAASAAEKAA